MSQARRRVELFCEDRGHELFASALIARIATEEDVRVDLRTASGRGGHGRAVTELRLWQKVVKAGHPAGSPDLLVAVIDCNCDQWQSTRSSISRCIDTSAFAYVAVACPDPHIERWCFSDTAAFHRVVGAAPPFDPGKCQRDLYKQRLSETLKDAGVVTLGSEMDVAPDIVAVMDLYRAGKAQPSLGHFIDELRLAFRGLAGGPIEVG